MKLDLEHIAKLLDDYVIALGDYHSWKDKLEASKDQTSKDRLATYLKTTHNKRDQIDHYLNKVNSVINSEATYFLLCDLIESIKSLYNILKSDLDNLNRHGESDPAVFLLDNYRQHLIYLADKYSPKTDG